MRAGISGLDRFKGGRGFEHPPVRPLFFGFRVRVGTGLLMLAFSWAGLWLYSFMALLGLAMLGLAMLATMVLDGVDLGVGLLLPRTEDCDEDVMVASIGPFRDANATGLVLGVGFLLLAFARADGIVLGALDLPVALMLVGPRLRGLAFDVSVKAQDQHQPPWNKACLTGSVRSGDCAAAAGRLWAGGGLLAGGEGRTQPAAAGRGLGPGSGLVYAAKPIVSAMVRARRFALPEFIALLPISLVTLVTLMTLMTLVALLALRALLNSHRVLGRLCSLPFVRLVLVFVPGAIGLAYSLFPWGVIDPLTLRQAASATEALAVIAVGCAVTVPAIAGHTVFSYRVFWGEARELSCA